MKNNLQKGILGAPKVNNDPSIVYSILALGIAALACCWRPTRVALGVIVILAGFVFCMTLVFFFLGLPMVIIGCVLLLIK